MPPASGPVRLPGWVLPAMASCLVLGIALGLAIPPVLRLADGNRRASTGTADAGQTPSSRPSVGPIGCSWTDADRSRVKDVDKPPASGEPRSGIAAMTITTNLGVIEIEIDLAKTPCTAASFRHLGAKDFYRDSACHRMLDQEIFILQCGDPFGDNTGGPSYAFADENLPGSRLGQAVPPWLTAVPGLPSECEQPNPSVTCCRTTPDTSCIIVMPTDWPSATPGFIPTPPTPDLRYPRATVALANAGPHTNGSQFFFVFQDTTLPASYTPFGNVTKGMDIIDRVAAAGHDNSEGAAGGRPRTPLVILSVTVTGP